MFVDFVEVVEEIVYDLDLSQVLFYHKSKYSTKSL